MRRVMVETVYALAAAAVLFAAGAKAGEYAARVLFWATVTRGGAHV